MSHRVLAARNLTLKQARRAQNRARYTWKVAVEAVKDAMHAVGRVQEAVSNRTVNAGKDVYRAVRRPLRARRHRLAELREQDGWNQTEWQVERELAAHPRDLRHWALGHGAAVRSRRAQHR